MAYPEKMEKTTTVEAACIDDDSTSIRNQTNTKRKQSSAMFDNARLATRRVIRVASSLPDNDTEGNVLLLTR